MKRGQILFERGEAFALLFQHLWGRRVVNYSLREPTESPLQLNVGGVSVGKWVDVRWAEYA